MARSTNSRLADNGNGGAGHGFGAHREDMKKLLLATRGKVFTLQNMNRLVECTRVRDFKTVSE